MQQHMGPFSLIFHEGVWWDFVVHIQWNLQTLYYPKPLVEALPPEGTQRCNTHQRGFAAWGARIWNWSKHMCYTASCPLKSSIVKFWRQNTKSKFPMYSVYSPRRVSSFSPSLPLLQRAQSLLSGCNQSLFCARCNLIIPVFYPEIFKKIQKSSAGTLCLD